MVEKKKKVVRAKQEKFSNVDKVKAKNIENIPMHLFARECMGEYGTSIVKNRALADYRDGLKPVQRRILWAMKGLGLYNNKGTTKCARIVGDVIGKYNPHGDLSAYSALTLLSGGDDGKDTLLPNKRNCPVPLVTGQGQLGYKNSDASAMRYTEAKLSNYAETQLLDPDYLKVVPMMLNYDDKDLEPTVLPSLVPNILLNGTNGIAVGVIGGVPPFKFDGVAKLVAAALKGKKITANACLKVLEFNFRFGGQVLNTEEELLEYYKTGVGSVKIAPNYEIVDNVFATLDAPPYYSVEKYKKALVPEMDKPSKGKKKRKTGFDEVLSVDDVADAKEPFRVEVVFKKGLSFSEKKQLASRIAAKMSDTIKLRTNVVEQISKEKVRFESTNIPALINKWVNWRVKLEVDCNKAKLNVIEEDIRKQKLYLFACDKLEVIFQVLKAKTDDPNKLLATKLKISIEDATEILELKVKKLSSLSKESIKKIIEEKKSIAKELKEIIKHPQNHVLKLLKSVVLAKNKYGLT